jgi:hypothetical protein
MIEILTGIIIIVMLGLLVWYQLRSSRVPPNAQLLFDILQEMGEEVTSDDRSNDVRTVNKAKT